MSVSMWRRLVRGAGVQVRLCSQYRAACLKEFGSPLEVRPFHRKPLEPDQVRVQVSYCSLNYNDVKYLERRSDGEKTLPYVPGYELSGEVVEAGRECELNEGDRVVGLIREGNGGLAQEAVLECRDVWQLHPDIPLNDAAALVSSHSTALLAFTHHHQLQEGSTILVITGAGGYGLAAVDVASSIFKAKVIALSDADSKGSLLRDRGAFAVFQNDLKRNYKEIMKVTTGKGVDLIYDAVGGPILNTVVKCLQDPEKGVILGTYRMKNKISKPGKTENKNDDDDEQKDKKDLKEEDKPLDPSQEVQSKFQTVNIFTCQQEDQEEYGELVQQTLDYYEDNTLGAHISHTFQLEDINEAIGYIKSKACTGKVLIQIKDN